MNTFGRFLSLVLGCLLIIVCFCDLVWGRPEGSTTTWLIAEPVDLTPGSGCEWRGQVNLTPGPYLLTITYGDGGVVNEGYPGFPGAPYSPYPNGRGCARLQVIRENRQNQADNAIYAEHVTHWSEQVSVQVGQLTCGNSSKRYYVR